MLTEDDKQEIKRLFLIHTYELYEWNEVKRIAKSCKTVSYSFHILDYILGIATAALLFVIWSCL